ncbi:MAG: hypothetical protein PHD76_10435 [Methylacidiphilales bacterium]|nr:hypothetical protein [Candidatus Methylacidiphilales bacterium]
MNIDLNRAISGLIAAGYMVGAYLYLGPETTWKAGIGLIFPLACIWFSEEMGNFTGSSQSVSITCPTPGLLVLIGGLVVLFLPVIMVIIGFIMKGST